MCNLGPNCCKGQHSTVYNVPLYSRINFGRIKHICSRSATSNQIKPQNPKTPKPLALFVIVFVR